MAQNFTVFCSRAEQKRVTTVFMSPICCPDKAQASKVCIKIHYTYEQICVGTETLR